MRSTRRALVLALALPVGACGGGGGGDGGPDSSCAFVLGDTVCSPIVGSCNQTIAVGDGNLGSFGTFSAETGGYLATGGGSGNDFDGGTNAGVFLTPPSGMSLSDITLSTYLDSDNSVLESATGPALTRTPTHGDPATDYISFETTAPFNGVKLTVNSPGLGTFIVYEFCGAAVVR